MHASATVMKTEPDDANAAGDGARATRIAAAVAVATGASSAAMHLAHM